MIHVILDLLTIVLSGASGAATRREEFPEVLMQVDGTPTPLSELDLPEPPHGSRFTIQFRENEVSIACPTQRPKLLPTMLMAFCGLQVPVLLLGVYLSDGGRFRDAWDPLLVSIGAMSLMVLIVLGVYWVDHLRWIKLTASRSRLAVSTTTLLGTRVSDCDRSDLAWVRNERDGLHIFRRGGPVTLFADQPVEERRWLAEVLCQVLRLEPLCPAQAEEFAVVYRSGYDGRLQPGFLSAQRGALRLRYHFEREPDFQFFDARQQGVSSWLKRAVDKLPLSPDDITGTDEADGWCWAHIGRGRVSVTIGCEDKVALHSALDRFRGAV